MKFITPEHVLAHMHLSPGASVADFGSGSGAHALALARKVGDGGRVYAVDVRKELLSRLQAEAERERLSAVTVVWGDIERIGGTKIADSSVDMVLISNVLFQVRSKYSTIREAARILRPHGRAVVVDWTGSFSGIGPHPEVVVNMGEIEHLFAELRFSLLKRFDAGSFHFGFLFARDII